MSITQLRAVGAGLFFLFIFLSGKWLSNSGKPLNVIILTIHKLISLAAVVFLVMTIYQINQVAKLSAIELIAGVVTGLFFLGTIISGGLLSTGKPMPAAILTMHQITPFLTGLSRAEIEVGLIFVVAFQAGLALQSRPAAQLQRWAA